MLSTEIDSDSVGNIDRLLDVARRGEPSQIGVLLNFYRGNLLRIAADSLDADVSVKVAPSDLVQETFVQAMRGFPEFRGATEAELRLWPTEILKNKAIDVHRSFRTYAKRDLSREVPLENGSAGCTELAVATDSPSAVVTTAENVQIFQNAMQRLSDDQRQVIQLRNIDQVEFEEIGRRMGKSPDAARKFWSRAVKKLAAELGIEEGSIGD
jgi:RNA polymerase sigma-70 factor (ECF subfamily)